MKVDRVTANHSLSSTAIQEKFQHSLSLLSLSQDVTARQKLTRHSRLAAEKAGTGDNKREQETKWLAKQHWISKELERYRFLVPRFIKRIR